MPKRQPRGWCLHQRELRIEGFLFQVPPLECEYGVNLIKGQNTQWWSLEDRPKSKEVREVFVLK